MTNLARDGADCAVVLRDPQKFRDVFVSIRPRNRAEFVIHEDVPEFLRIAEDNREWPRPALNWSYAVGGESFQRIESK